VPQAVNDPNTPNFESSLGMQQLTKRTPYTSSRLRLKKINPNVTTSVMN